MKKKVKGSSPAIDTSRLANDIINPSLEGYFISLFDHNEYNDIINPLLEEYSISLLDHNEYDEDCDIIYDEGIEEYLTTTVDLFEYTQKATTKTIDIVKQILKLFEKYEIVAFNIDEVEYNRIMFFLKNAKDHFIMLTLSYCYEINTDLFMNNIVNLEEFRCYGNNNSGLYGFYMKDELIRYDFELLKFENLFIMDRIFLLSVAQISSKKKYGLYFVIKNNLGDPIVFTQLRCPDDIAIFNEALTEADPQAGILFSLSYNANK